MKSWLIPLLILFSCGKKEEHDEAPPVPQRPVPVAIMPSGLTSFVDNEAVLGAWISSCENVDSKSRRTSFEFRPDLLLFTLVWYSDPDCRTTEASFRYISQYRIDLGRLTARLYEAHIRIDSEDLRRSAEAGNSCGFDGWQAQTWLNITGHVCSSIENTGGVWTGWSMKGTLMFNQPYEVDGDVLRLSSVLGVAEYRRE